MAPPRKRQQAMQRKAKAQGKNLKRLFVRQNSDARQAMLKYQHLVGENHPDAEPAHTLACYNKTASVCS